MRCHVLGPCVFSISQCTPSVRHTTLGTTDGLHDLLRWSVGRFSKLSELFGQLGDYVGQLSESDAKTQQHFVTTATQLHDLANGIVGLSSSVRHCQGNNQSEVAPYIRLPDLPS